MTNSIENDLEIIKRESWFKRHAEHYFFEAMNHGYAADAAKGSLEDLSGSRTLEFKQDKWRVLDLYMVTPAGRGSGGTTTIWYGDIPIWMMQYLGFYEREEIPFLRAALSDAYKQSSFIGGRGPQFFTRDGLHYVNIVQENDFFGHAHGQERIYAVDGVLLGQHRYQSQWLTKGLW